MKLRIQVFLTLLLPVVLSLVCAGGLVAVYLRFYYADSIQTTSEDMKTQQAEVLAQVSGLISSLGGWALQGKVNAMLLSSQMMRSQGEKDLKKEWSETGNAVNGVIYGRWTKGEVPLQSIPGLNATSKRSYYYAMWGIGSQNVTIESLNETTRANMRWAASFDYLSQSMLRLGTSNQVYFAFESDGFFYFLPTMYKGYFYNATAAGYLASKCLRTLGQDRYDPRCRPFYREVVASGVTDWVTLATPYLLAEKNTIGQTVCAPIWVQASLSTMHCLDFDLLDLRSWLQTVKIGSSGYAYLVTSKGLPYIHPKLNESWTSDPPDLLQLEFSRDVHYDNVSVLRADYEANSNLTTIKEEIGYFSQSVLPQLMRGSKNITSYNRLGATYIAGLTPLSLRFSMQNTSNYLSVAVVMEITQFTALYNTLVTKGEDLVTNVGVALAVLLFVISVVGLLTAAWLSHLVLSTLRTIIQHINAILARDYRRYIDIPEFVPDEIKVMYDLLRFMKHITQYNSTKEAELQELIAVLKDLDDFKEVQEFLTCCQRIALKCLETQNYSESVEICMLFTCVLDHHKKVSTLKSDPVALKALVKLLDVLALNLLEIDQSQALSPSLLTKVALELQSIQSKLEVVPGALQLRVDYLKSSLESASEEERPMLHQELHAKYLRKRQELKETREKAATELYRRVVFGTEYGTLMKGRTIENVISLAIHIVEKLDPKDMFGFFCYTDRTDVNVPTGSLDQQLACIRALELFNQPEGTADFYIGLLGGLKELARKRPHATSHLYFKHKQPIQREYLVLVTTGLLLNTSREAEALQDLSQYSGELLVLWLNSGKEKCVQGFQCIQQLLEQWVLAETNLAIVEIKDSEHAATDPRLYQFLGIG